MVEIAPVSSAATPAYMPLTAATGDDAAIDSRRYTQFDHSATEAGTTTMSFDDFVDMVNPLQHIPVISSVYRAITGDTINPVSRIVGDMAYSGPLGLVSVAISGISAVANTVIESQTGKDTTGNIIAALFGGDDAPTAPAPTQLAETTPAAVTAEQAPIVLTAAAVVPVTIVKPNDKADQLRSAKAQIAAAAPSSDAAADDAEDDHPAVSPAIGSDTVAPSINPTKKFLPLDRTRVFSNSAASAANNIESQNRLISLSEGSHAMRVGHMIYTSPLMNGPKPMPPGSTVPKSKTANVTDIPDPSVAASSATASSESSTATSNGSAATPVSASESDTTLTTSAANSLSSAQNGTLPPALFDDLMILKRLNQYRNFATAPVTNGATLNYTN